LELDKANKAVAALKADKTAITNHIIDTFPKQKIKGAMGKLGKIEIKSKEIPQVRDREKFNAYVKKNNAFDMLQARVSEKAIMDRLADGIKMPFIKMFNKVTVSCTKVG
jgi:hypothetical protein